MKASPGNAVPVGRAGPLAAAAKFAVGLCCRTVSNLAQWCGVLMRPPRAKIPPVPTAAIVGIVGTLVVIVAAMFLIDSPAREWARLLPSWFENAFEQITNAGYSGWFLVPGGVAVLLLAAVASPSLPRPTQGAIGTLAARFGFVFLAIGAPGLFTTIIKRVIGRARPYVDVHGSPFTYMPFAWRPEYASLPSGHAATAASAAIAIGAVWPRTRPLMWLYALIVMFSRVVVLAHHPSDVIAGALVGCVGAELVRRYFAARCLVFSPRDLSPYPGPTLRRIWAAARQVAAGRRKKRQPVESPPD
jgi:membrane-associated phospholipid phosphatase